MPNGGKPFYIHIDSSSVSITNPALQGSASSKLQQVWVEVGSNNLGVYPLPSTFPVLVEPGTYKLLIQPGIKNKGISDQRMIYPPLKPYFVDITFNPSIQSYTVNPIYTYKEICNFEMNEGFEFSNNFDASMQVITDSNVFEGANSGMLEMSPISGVTSYTPSLSIPIGKQAFLEFNYKADKPFSVNMNTVVAGNSSDIQLVVVDSKKEWNKFYIDISPDISSLNTGSYKFYIKSYNDDSTQTKRVYLDNVKLIYM